MEKTNVYCESVGCGNTADFFVFKENQKIRSCKNHITEKSLHFFRIECENYISTSQDAEKYLARQALVDKGRANLSALGARCSSELMEALNAIENEKKNVLKNLENCFKEMTEIVTVTCNGINNQLSLLGEEFEPYLSGRQKELSPIAKLLCSELAVTPMFLRFGIADVSDSISITLSESWTIANENIHSTLQCLDQAHMNEAIGRALAEAFEQAKKGIQEALQFSDLLIGDKDSFDEAKFQIVSETLMVEMERSERNRKWLKRTWDLRQQYNLPEAATAEIGYKLASLLSRRCGDFLQSEEILKRCYGIVERSSPLSEDSMLLSNGICGVYFDSARYEKAEQLGAWVLSTFEPADFPPEHYWTALLYLTYSQRIQEKKREASAALENWQRRVFKESKLSELVRLVTCGYGSHWNDDDKEAMRCMLQAKRIGASLFPTSPFTALVFSLLAALSDGETRGQYLRQAQCIYDAIAPMSAHAAVNLSDLGTYFSSTEQWDQAGDFYNRAQSIFEVVNPSSVHAAGNLYCIGKLCLSVKGWDTAAEYFGKALSRYEVATPKSHIAAKNLSDLAKLYHKQKKLTEVERCYREVQLIFNTTEPMSVDAAKNLTCFGLLLQEVKRLPEAVSCFQRAQEIFEVSAPNSIHSARNVNHLGNLFLDMNQLKEAEECYRKAQSIYGVAAPKSIEAARNLAKLSAIYLYKSQLSEAESCCEQAKFIYEKVAPTSIDEAKNFDNLGLVLKEKNESDRAESCFLQAHSIFQVVSPQSIDAAANLSNIGNLYFGMGRLSEGEPFYRGAQRIYEATSPNSAGAANNLYSLGALLQTTEKWAEAAKCFQQAQSAFEIAAPTSIYAAFNLHYYGLLCVKMMQLKEAVECYSKARAIFKEAAPSSTHTAKNLEKLGALYWDMARWTEAISCLQEAESIYKVVDPQFTDFSRIHQIALEMYEAEGCSQQAEHICGKTATKSTVNAKKLWNLGNYYLSKELFDDAEKCYLKAKSIYEKTDPKSVDAARNLKSMGILFEVKGQRPKAIEYFKQAAQLNSSVSIG